MIRSSLLALLAASFVGPALTAQQALTPQPWQHEPRTNPDEPYDPPGPPAEAPGADDCRGMSWEPTVLVDPNNPLVVAIAQGSTVQVSVDGGNTFPQTLTATVPGPTPSDPGWCPGGDPSLAFDAQGRLFLTYLGTRCNFNQSCNPPAGGAACSVANGRDVFLTGWNRVGNNFVQFTGPRNVTALSGHGAPHNADKEWLAADWRPGHPFSNRLYVVWSDLDQEPWQIWTTFSADQGTTWSPAQQVSAPGDGRRVWPAHNTVGRGHDVYIAYHSQGGFLDGAPDYDVPDGVSGYVPVFRSTNGGVTYTKTATNPFDATGTSSEADMTWNRQDKPVGVIPRASFWTLGSIQPWILADPHVSGRIYVVCADDPDDDIDSGDAGNVVLARSNDFGATWNAPVRVDDTPGTGLSVFPTAAIDPVGGAIVVTWYDNRSGAIGASGDRLLDLRARASYDGGLSWLPSIDIDDGQLDPGLSTSCRFCCTAGQCAAGAPRTLRIGEYNGVSFGQCGAHMVWAGNQVCGSGGSLLDTFYDRDPEMGGDLTPPTLFCPPNVAVGCNDPTDPANTGIPIPTDDCDLSPSLGWNDVILPGNCPPSTVRYTIERIWNSSDQAGNLTTCSQLISVVDFDPPVITAPPPLVIVTAEGCVDSASPQIQSWIALATAVDACGSAQLSYNLPAVFPGTCGAGRTTNVILSAADECGNSDFALASVTVIVPAGAGFRFCFGDGSGTPCPCGNTGLAGHGCDIAQGTGGVCLTAQNFAPNGGGGGTVDLLGTNFPVDTQPTVKAIRSLNLVNGQAGIVFGDGKLCLGSPIVRLATLTVQDGKVRFPIAHDAGPGRFSYQLWFRNLPIGFCDPNAGFNMSNAVALDW